MAYSNLRKGLLTEVFILDVSTRFFLCFIYFQCLFCKVSYEHFLASSGTVVWAEKLCILTVATVMANAALAEHWLISSSICKMRFTRATCKIKAHRRVDVLGDHSQGSAVEPVISSGGGIVVLL